MSREVWAVEDRNRRPLRSFAWQCEAEHWPARRRGMHVVRYVPAVERELVRTRWEVRLVEPDIEPTPWYVGPTRKRALEFIKNQGVKRNSVWLVRIDTYRRKEKR